MSKEKQSFDINIEPNKFYNFVIKLDGLYNKIEYSDSIDLDKKIVFSANTSNGYITNEPIRNLYFQENVSDLKITIFNLTDISIIGKFDLMMIKTDVDVKSNIDVKMLDTNYDVDDIFELGKKFLRMNSIIIII